MTEINSEIKLIYEYAIEEINPYNAVSEYLNENKLDLAKYSNIYVVGCGKGVVPMAIAVEDFFGKNITQGCVVTKYGHTDKRKLNFIEIIEAGHPLPDKNSIIGTNKVEGILQKAGEKDLLLSLVSGGGSALWVSPSEGLNLEDKMKVSSVLLKCGASIHEINCIRKHLSNIKGGNAARLSRPAEVISLVISDVIGDNLDVIASGPFYPDSSTYKDALDIIDKYNIGKELPENVLNHLEKGRRGEKEETPKEEKYFNKVENNIISSNQIAVKAAAKKAIELGYEVIFWPQNIEGECRDAAQDFSMRLLQLKNSLDGSKICLVGGGETTVTLGNSNGKGGRNQEFAMVASWVLSGEKNICLASIGTDGNDGPTDAAGAFCDGDTVDKAVSEGIDYGKELENHNAYNFFKKIDGLIITGPTNTNVADIVIGLIG
jgi:glycerate-2-kinase